MQRRLIPHVRTSGGDHQRSRLEQPRKPIPYRDAPQHIEVAKATVLDVRQRQFSAMDQTHIPGRLLSRSSRCCLCIPEGTCPQVMPPHSER